MIRSTLILAVASVLVAAPSEAQRTWVVDAAGGAGVDFTDLPPAVAAAAPGDSLRIRDGSYTAFTTSKGLRLLGAPGVQIARAPIGPVVVQNLPAGQTFAMDGVHAFPFPTIGELRLLGNAGAVHVESARSYARVTVQGCAHVSFSAVELGDVRIADSLVVFAGARIVGLGMVGASVPAVVVQRSLVLLTDSRVDGPRFVPGIGPMDTWNGPAFELAQSRLAVSAGCAIHAGVDGFGLGTTPPGIRATASALELDPTAVVTGFGGAPAIASDRPVVLRPIPDLSADGGGPGATLDVRLTTAPGIPALVGLSAPSTPVWLPGLGDLGLDPGSLAILFGGPVPPNGVLTLSVVVPNAAIVRGTPITAQAVVAVPTGLTASLPVTVVLH